MTKSGHPQRLRLLLDTNVFIAVEPFYGSTEAGLARGATLVRLAAEQGHTLLGASPQHAMTFARARTLRALQRLAELQKYPMLAECRITKSLEERAGSSVPGSNDHRDLRLLAALDARAATYLVSEDARLRRRARRARLRDATLTIDEAIALLEGLQPKNPTPPPHVTEVPAYTLDIEQDIFDSLRQDYGPNFDRWLDKVRADSESRICLAVLDDEEDYVALAILKEERECPYEFRAPVIKISTFKVAPHHAGAKYGELLLKSIFTIAARKQISTLYVETFSKHELLVDLLEVFGFQKLRYHTSRNELVLTKSLIYPVDSSDYSPLSYHALFGPPAIKTTGRVHSRGCGEWVSANGGQWR